MKIDWDHLRIFLAVAREGTLGAAARKVGQTQPTIGRRLTALEGAVGQALFQRTTTGFVLTDEGNAVLRHAERIEEEVLSFERQLAGNEASLDGSLRISSSDWFGTLLLAPVLAELGKQHPALSIELLTDSRLYSLPRREADIVFRIVPFDEPEVISRRLLHIPYSVYRPIGMEVSPLDGGRGVRLITMDTAFSDMPDARWIKQLLPGAHPAYRSNNRSVQARLCAQGAGVAVLPVPLGDATAGIEQVDLGERPPGRDTFMGYHRDLKRLARLRALVDLVVRRLAN
jgi:DNA-binding transcriptional LysR family regulator